MAGVVVTTGDIERGIAKVTSHRASSIAAPNIPNVQVLSSASFRQFAPLFSILQLIWCVPSGKTSAGWRTSRGRSSTRSSFRSAALTSLLASYGRGAPI